MTDRRDILKDAPAVLDAEAIVCARRQLERKEQEETRYQEKRCRYDTAMADAPKLELSNETAWNISVAKNMDPYGKGICDYARDWGRIMQKLYNEGNLTKQTARDASDTADIYGMSGFSWSCARNMLQEWWIHGNLLKSFRL